MKYNYVMDRGQLKEIKRYSGGRIIAKFSTVLHNFGGNYIPAGQYSFPFSFKTGDHYPASYRVYFRVKLGQIKRRKKKGQNKIRNASFRQRLQFKAQNHQDKTGNHCQRNPSHQKRKTSHWSPCQIMMLLWPGSIKNSVLFLKKCLQPRWRCKDLLYFGHKGQQGWCHGSYCETRERDYLHFKRGSEESVYWHNFPKKFPGTSTGPTDRKRTAC